MCWVSCNIRHLLTFYICEMPRFNNETRKKKIKELIKLLEKGLEVAKRDFDTAVGTELAKLYKQRWAEQQELRDMEVPAEVKEYEQKLQEALMMYGRYEQYNPNKKSKSNLVVNRKAVIDSLGSKADSLFEDAMTRLEEIITADQSLRVWFDRDIDFSFGSHLSIDPVGMPRVITSKSLDNLAKDGLAKNFGMKTKAEVKLDILRDALEELEKKELTVEEVEANLERSKQQTEKLKGMLANLKKR